ncbi:MAG: hypothetical protein IMF07_06175 [Proteobacteria bacterium]|nr:hypothetical protein [Pseudomonadota bacterium]
MQRFDLKKGLLGAFTGNILLKLISLLTAIILWSVVSGERDTEWAFLVPLEVEGVAADKVITNNIPEFIDVRIQGAKTFLSKVTPQELTVVLNGESLKTGSNFFPLTPNQVRTPRGAKVTRINPSYITLEVDRRLKKSLNVVAEIEGKPPRGFVLGSIEVVPPVIEVSAAAGDLKVVKVLKTGIIDISEIKSDLKTEVAIDTLGGKLTLSRQEPVAVTVHVKELTSKVRLSSLDILIENTQLKSSMSRSRAKLLLEVPRSLVADVKKGLGVKVVADASGLAAGSHSVELKAVLPERVTLLSLSPEKVKIKLWEQKK